MIPKFMKKYLLDVVPEWTWRKRLIKTGSLRYLEFGPLDVDRLSRMGIEADNLGPHLVACMWDEGGPLGVGGYLVVDNLAMGKPSMGGIRLGPELIPSAIHNLARGMTLKNAAADLHYGGGKCGIVASRDLNPEEHREIVRGFARLIHRYRDIYNPGPDVGTNDADMKTIAIENGLDYALSKPVEMGGNRIDRLGAAAGGLVIAVKALLEELPRLRVFPRFQTMEIPKLRDVTILIQGFGAVGAHAARIFSEEGRGRRPVIVGISDEKGYLYDPEGLPVDDLFRLWEEKGIVTFPYFLDGLDRDGASIPITFSNNRDNLLREHAFCLIPAAPIANYLGVDDTSRPSMTVDRMGEWRLIVEGTNTYSPDPARRVIRSRMERAVYREKGVIIATDYLVNSGGVIFAAQERMIPTPAELHIPQERIGNRAAVDAWLNDHRTGFEELAERRRKAAISRRDEIIRRNMKELVDHLIEDVNLLPCEVAEKISISRITSSESHRKVAEVMEDIPIISIDATGSDAARIMIEANSDMLAVTSKDGSLVGVVTEWDITRASATGIARDTPLKEIMTAEAIVADPEDTILDVVRKLEHHEISAMPVVEGKQVIGVINSDILARRTLYRLLQSRD
jgi:glutamate dehydrogenase (NAD(P)+)